MKRYNTIFFDLDGTLTNSSPGILSSVKYALTEMGREIPDEAVLGEFLGPPLTDSFREFCGMTEAEAREAAALYRSVYVQGERCVTENSLYEGIVRTLERLTMQGKTLAVATTKPKVIAEKIVTHYGIRKYFTAVCGSAPDGSGGDKAEVIRSALEMCGETDLSQALMIGDRFYDIEGAKTAGIDSVGVLYGYGSRSELEKAGATYIVSTASEIAKLIIEDAKQIDEDKNIIREMRKAAGMTQRKLSEFLHIPLRTIERWEAKDRTPPPYVPELIEYKLRHEGKFSGNKSFKNNKEEIIMENIIKGEQLYEGKAKKVYATNDPDYVIVDYKDDATAFNGEKKGTIRGKGVVNNKMTNYMFGLLEKEGVPTHLVKEISDRETVVKKVEIVPLEVIVRNVAAGSFSKKLGIEEGTPLKRPTLEFSYKNDDLGDPFINDYYALGLGLATQEEIDAISKYAFMVNDFMLKFFKEHNIDLIDFKIEFGRFHGEIILADEISPDTCRFWDSTTHEKLDKDRFRRDMGGVEEAYQEMMKRIFGE